MTEDLDIMKSIDPEISEEDQETSTEMQTHQVYRTEED